VATLVKRDLIGSSMFNTETSYGARAERRVFVRLDPDDSFVNKTPMGRAIEKAIDGQYHHPDDDSLPLKEAGATQVGKDAFEVILTYKRSRTSGGALDVPSSSMVVSNWRSRMVAYRSHYTSESFRQGIPTGGVSYDIGEDDPEPINHPRARPWWEDQESIDLLNVNSQTYGSEAKFFDKKPRSRTVYIPETTISVPVVLNQYQFSSLAQNVIPLIGTLNSNLVTRLGGMNFQPGQLLLTGIDSDWVNQRSLGAGGFVNELTFSVSYVFAFRYGGHVTEVLYWLPTVLGQPGGEWVNSFRPSGRYAEFQGFPA
jgi:hypothetical protein